MALPLLAQSARWSRPASSLRPGEPLHADIWRIDATRYPDEIRLFVRIRDRDGIPVTHLAPPYSRDPNWRRHWSALREQLGLSTVPIDSFSVREYNEWDSSGVTLLLLLDYSGSLTPLLRTVQAAAETLVTMLQPPDALGIASFSEEFALLSPPQPDGATLLANFRQNRHRGLGTYTALYDALLRGIELLARLPDSLPRAVIVFTDGDDNASTATLLQVYERARAANVLIFPVGFGYTQDSLLTELASYTGGRYTLATSIEALAPIFAEIYRSLRNYYLVRYRPPRYAGLHRVRLTLALPGTDTLQAEGVYDTAPITPFDTVGKEFERIILFDFDKATLRPEAIPIIEELAELLRRYPRVKLEVQGHTDNIGTEEYNLRLSEARARAVVEALVERGIDPRRLRPRGFGMSMPVAPNDTEENRQKNRRTVFKIIAK